MMLPTFKVCLLSSETSSQMHPGLIFCEILNLVKLSNEDQHGNTLLGSVSLLCCCWGRSAGNSTCNCSFPCLSLSLSGHAPCALNLHVWVHPYHGCSLFPRNCNYCIVPLYLRSCSLFYTMVAIPAVQHMINLIIFKPRVYCLWEVTRSGSFLSVPPRCSMIWIVIEALVPLKHHCYTDLVSHLCVGS